jgi:hypothetical protein
MKQVDGTSTVPGNMYIGFYSKGSDQQRVCRCRFRSAAAQRRRAIRDSYSLEQLGKVLQETIES